MSMDRIAASRAASAGVKPGLARVHVHLLGLIDYGDCLALQQRLVYEAAGDDDGRITLLICEHPATITIGRQGSRTHVRLGRRELASRCLQPRWVNRGGGCLVHAPGQLAIYPIVPLDWHGWSVGEYMRRLQGGLLAALEELRLVCRSKSDRWGVWGRTGQVAAVGAAVKGWVTYYGAYVNVSPPVKLLRCVNSDPWGGSPMTSLVVERGRPVRMSGAREAVVRRVTEAFGCDRHHLFTGHPFLTAPRAASHGSAARVG